MSILDGSRYSRLADFVYPPLTRRIRGEPGRLYLTFDDGPVAGILDEVLDVLNQFQSRASFFCLGREVEANPLLFAKIIESGHQTGNHSYSHPDGFRSSLASYLADIEKASLVIPSGFFRPPYGRMYPWQAYRIALKYEIVLWDVMSNDYSSGIQREKILRQLIAGTRDGSVIVMHDSQKAAKNLKFVLPRYLEHFRQKGFQFDIIGGL